MSSVLEVPLSQLTEDAELDESIIEFARTTAEKDFFYFARNVCGYTHSKIEWDEVDPDNPFDKSLWKTHQKTLEGTDYGISRTGPHAQVVKLLTGGKNRIHLEAPRGSYKTTITIIWLLWRVLKDRNLRVLYAMDVGKEAFKKLGAIKDVIEKTVALRKLWPDFGVDSTGENGAFTVTGRTTRGIIDPTFEGIGLDSAFTGSHRDIIVTDDIVNWKNIRNPDSIEKVLDFFEMLDPLLDPGGVYLVIGTRYGDADLYGHIIRELSTKAGGRWELCILDCGMEMYQDDNKFWDLRGTPTFAHLTKDVLKSKLLTMRRSKFASQYMNQCIATGEATFAREQFRFEPFDETWMPLLKWHILTDSALGGSKEYGCYAVVAMVGVDAGGVAYLADLRVGIWQVQKFPVVICDVYEEWAARGCRATQVCMEKVGINNAYKAMLDGEMKSRSINIRVTSTPRGANEGSKDQRIFGLAHRFEQRRFVVLDTVPTYFNDGIANRVLFDPGGFKNEKSGLSLPGGELVDEFIMMPRSRRKDIADCLADIDISDSEGARVCQGSGHKKHIRDILLSKAGLTAGGGIQRRGASGPGASRWDRLASRIPTSGR